MIKRISNIALLLTIIGFIGSVQMLHGQITEPDSSRILALETKLKFLAESSIPELNKKVDFTVSESSVKEFLRGLAEISELNINVDPAIEGKVSNNFKKEITLNILVFLCKEHDLYIDVLGTILSFHQLQKKEVIKKKEYAISYSAYNDLLNIDVKDDTLYNVLRDISQKSQKNVIASPQIKDILISSFVSNVPFEEAIHSLAFANDLLVHENDNNSYLIEPNEEFLNSQIQSPGRARNQSNPSNNNTRQNRFRSNIEVNESGDQTFISANISKFPIMDVLNSISSQSGLDYVFISEPAEAISLQISDMPHDAFLDLLLSASNYTFQKKNNVYLIGGRNDEGLRSSELIQLKYRATTDLISFIPVNISEGVEIKEFKELNGLLISGSEPQIEEIKRFINQLDRLIPVVQIEVIVIDVQKGREVKTGISAGVSDSIPTGGTILPGIDFTLSSASINSTLSALDKQNVVNLGQVNPNFYTTLQAMEQNNNIKIRSTPKLATLNGHEASMTIGRTEYYLEQTQNIQGANNLVTTITPQYREISADLKIVINPIVSADEHVTLDIVAEFADFLPSFVINGPPGKASRNFNSLIRIRNNEMIVLGGLEEESKSKGSSGIPILSRIPVLNWLFGNRTTNKSESRLLIFIRPTILY